MVLDSIQFIVTTDAANLNKRFDTNGNPGNASIGTTLNSTLVGAFPDLIVQPASLTVTPAAPQSGNTLTIQWLDQNIGNGSTTVNWVDNITIFDATTSQTLLNVNVPYNQATSGSILPNGASARQYQFTLPDGDFGVGNLIVAVATSTSIKTKPKTCRRRLTLTPTIARLFPP